MNKEKEIKTPEQRWEDGDRHNDLSYLIYNFIEEYDFKYNGDRFYFKSGGDGDNGEELMYLLDVFFDSDVYKNSKLNNQ